MMLARIRATIIKKDKQAVVMPTYKLIHNPETIAKTENMAISILIGTIGLNNGIA